MRYPLAKRILPALLLLTLVLAPLVFAETALAQSASASTKISLWDTFSNPTIFLGWIGAEILLRIAGMFTWLGGVVLNTSINISVLQMSNIVNSTGAISATWSTLRDLANIVFIFLLLAIGIGTMLRLSGYGIKQLLAQVLIVAILINFSLFFTKLIIDVPNRLAIEFYKGMQISNCNGGAGSIGLSCGDAGLSDRFMNALKIQTLMDTRSIQAKYGTAAAVDTLSGGKIFLIGFFGSIFLFIAAFIFFAAGILLAQRLALLVLVMVFSPIAFVFMVVPKMGGYASKWWATLFNNALFPAAYLLLTWVSLRIIEDKNFLFGQMNSSDTFATALSSGEGALVIIFNFMVVSVLMIASLVIASSMGAYGAEGMMKMGKSLQKWGQGILGGVTIGLGAYLGRRYIGGGADALSRKDGLREATKDKGIKGVLARGIISSSQRIAGSSFDVRATGAGKELSASIPGGLGTAGGKGGFTKMVKDYAEKQQKFAASLGHDEEKVKELEREKDRLKGEHDKVMKAEGEFLETLKDTLTGAKEGLEKAQSEYVFAKDSAPGLPTVSERDVRYEGQMAKYNDGVARMNAAQEKMRGAKEKADTAQRAVQEKEKSISVATKSHEERTRKIDSRVKEVKGARQEGVAETIETSRWFMLRTRAQRRAAAKLIREKMKKSTKDKVLDAIKELEEEGGEKGGEGGGVKQTKDKK